MKLTSDSCCGEAGLKKEERCRVMLSVIQLWNISTFFWGVLINNLSRTATRLDGGCSHVLCKARFDT